LTEAPCSLIQGSAQLSCNWGTSGCGLRDGRETIEANCHDSLIQCIRFVPIETAQKLASEARGGSMKTRKSRLTVLRFPFPVSGEPGVEPLNLENEK
jgi:hypothetical protein